jgi:uncharacterized protein Yka (UPF0111/DUF47 family)
VKTKIIEQLGETELLLPSLIAQGLAANSRVKARLTALQAAQRRAQSPSNVHFDLMEECRAASIDPMPMEALVNSASLLDCKQLTAPGLGKLGIAIWDDVAAMGAAVRAGDEATGDALLARLAAMRAACWPEPSDTIALSQIASLTGISESTGQSLHRLVMDLHKALNQILAAHAEELVAGAHAYGLPPGDRAVVEAFMRGLEATRKLKFGHPGLGTIASRSGTHVTIQNDIGETDAHVVVVTIESNSVTVTYTDAHLARAKFFTTLLRTFPIQWSGLDRKSSEGLGGNGVFYLVTGRYQGVDHAECLSVLEAIGASLVFLIDWNKARKVLQAWITKADAIRVLDWAAHNRFGHRGFLELGGSELVASAVRHAAPARIGFGERLDHVLGRDGAVDFLKTVLRVSAEALLEGSSVKLARDRIEADLVRHLESVDATLLAIVARQAGLARDIAAAVVQFIADLHSHRPCDRTALATQARRIEEKADRIALEARSEIARFGAGSAIGSLVNRMEEAIDELEQAAFAASLLSSENAPDVLQALAVLSAVAVSGAEAAASGIAAATTVPEGHRVDSEDALAAVGGLFEAEHKGDAVERGITVIALRGEFDLKTTLCVLELSRALERAIDQLAGFGHLLHEHMLAELSM